jgi:GAF domain-containing protein
MDAQKQLETLFQISRALVGKQSLEEILQQIVIRSADLTGSKICSLMLLNEKKDALVIRATQSLSTAYRQKPPIRVGYSISGKAVKQKKAIQAPDVTKDPSYGYPEIARQENLKSLLSVPMMIGDEVIGVLNYYTEDETVFSKQDIQLIQTIANQAAMAIEHMRVISEENSARAELVTRKSVDTAKRVLMKKYRMNEEDAHHLLQKMSMERNKPLKDIAEAVILSVEL